MKMIFYSLLSMAHIYSSSCLYDLPLLSPLLACISPYYIFLIISLSSFLFLSPFFTFPSMSLSPFHISTSGMASANIFAGSLGYHAADNYMTWGYYQLHNLSKQLVAYVRKNDTKTAGYLACRLRVKVSLT